MLMDVSSEMIHALLPVYLVTVLGPSMLAVRFIEGSAEATAMIVKIFSGALSDWLGKRKLLAALGYGLGALTKPIFPLATGIGWIVTARFVDRIGKGIRGAPRDALVADLSPPEVRGASFGLRQSLDTVGAFIGPLAAIGLMMLTADNFPLVFWIAVIPAFLSFGLIWLGVKEPVHKSAMPEREKRRWQLAFKRLPLAYWLVVVFSAALTLARFSEAFLILRAQSAGMSIALVPVVLVVMNVVYALTAYPVGVLSDRLGRNGVLAIGVLVLIIADIVLAFAGDISMVLAGVALWGLHMGLTQGLLSALIADTAPADLRGTAFGMFNFAAGLAALPASVLAGALWDRFGPAATFLASAGFSGFSLFGLMVFLLYFQARPPAGKSIS